MIQITAEGAEQRNSHILSVETQNNINSSFGKQFGSFT